MTETQPSATDTISPRTWRPGSQFAVGVLVVVALTQGPVYAIWQVVTPSWDPSSTAPAIVTTFLVLYALVSHGIRWSSVLTDLRRLRIGLLVALSLWLLCSTLWSVSPSSTFTNTVCFAGTVLVGYWFMQAFDPRQQAALAFSGTAIGVLASAVLIATDWSGARDVWGQWVGLYGNRNSLAPVAAVCLVSGVFVLVYLRRMQTLPHRTLVAGSVLVLQVIALALLVGSRSRTSVVAMAASAAALSVVSVAHKVTRSVLGRASVIAGSGAALILIGMVVSGSASSMLGRDDGLNGRDLIWDATLEAAGQRPLVGWGFRGIWANPEFRTTSALDPAIFEAHNGYLELLVGGGLIALVMIMVCLGSFAVGVLATPTATRRPGWSWSLVFVVFGAVASVFESFIVGNQLLWMLMAAGLASTAVTDQRCRAVAGVGRRRPTAGADER